MHSDSGIRWWAPLVGGALVVALGCSGTEPGLTPEPAEASTAAALVPDGFGLNANDLTNGAIVDGVVSRFQQLGARWARVEINRAQPPSYWVSVVTKFNNAGVNVLAVIDHSTWGGGARDPEACDYFPTNFGWSLVTDWLSATDPYVQALKGRVQNWELWNEVGSNNTWLCPGDYAFLLVEARLRWTDIGNIGISLESQGSGTGARDYASELYNNTDKVNWYRATYGDVPWQKVMLHPYPGGESPEGYIPNQAWYLRNAQPKPLWFTEIGWYGGSDQAGQADMLSRSYNTALGGGYAEKQFWFSLFDLCNGETFGLLTSCVDPNAATRQSFTTYRNLTGGGATSYFRLVFDATDARRTTSTGDWRSGSFKAECGGSEVVTGLSRSSSSGWAHAALCRAGGDSWRYPHNGCYTRAFNGGDNRGTTSSGDWASGYFKGECGANEYVAGISQTTGHQVDAILCCPGSVAHGACAARVFDGGDSRETTASGDWDSGNYKGECGTGRYVAGVSRNPSTGSPHSLLCCSP